MLSLTRWVAALRGLSPARRQSSRRAPVVSRPLAAAGATSGLLLALLLLTASAEEPGSRPTRGGWWTDASAATVMAAPHAPTSHLPKLVSPLSNHSGATWNCSVGVPVDPISFLGGKPTSGDRLALHAVCAAAGATAGYDATAPPLLTSRAS